MLGDKVERQNMVTKATYLLESRSFEIPRKGRSISTPNGKPVSKNLLSLELPVRMRAVKADQETRLRDAA